jgi:hypothetical protein
MKIWYLLLRNKKLFDVQPDNWQFESISEESIMNQTIKSFNLKNKKEISQSLREVPLIRKDELNVELKKYNLTVAMVAGKPTLKRI